MIVIVHDSLSCTILILETLPCGRFFKLRDEQKVRFGISRPISVRHWLRAFALEKRSLSLCVDLSILDFVFVLYVLINSQKLKQIIKQRESL